MRRTPWPSLAFFLFLTGCAATVPARGNLGAERGRQTDAYLAEFASPLFQGSEIGPAIREVLMRLPATDFAQVTNRRRPVMFVEVYDSGTARFASTSEVMMGPQDRPAFQEGMTLVKISTALEQGPRKAVMGVVAHELAHRVRDSIRRGHTTCGEERAVNALIRDWGFVEEFEAARLHFGRDAQGQGVASCQE